MNGKKAKMIRRFVYGKTFGISDRLYTNVKLGKSSDTTVVCLGLRRAYQLLKRDYLAGRGLSHHAVIIARAIENREQNKKILEAINEQRLSTEAKEDGRKNSQDVLDRG